MGGILGWVFAVITLMVGVAGGLWLSRRFGATAG